MHAQMCAYVQGEMKDACRVPKKKQNKTTTKNPCISGKKEKRKNNITKENKLLPRLSKYIHIYVFLAMRVRKVPQHVFHIQVS